MDYEKAYKEALERAKKEPNTCGSQDCDAARQIFRLFPGLAEDENERIKKDVKRAISVALDYSYFDEETADNCLAWLEKQGNDNDVAKGILRGAAIHLITWIDCNAPKGNMCLSNMECEDIENALVNADWDRIYAYMKKKLEKKGEQILANSTQTCKDEQKPTDKVEPKFKVGDWIIRSAEGFKHNTYLVTEVKDYYICEELKGRRVTFTFNDAHKNFKLWNISDAKDGDVLACGDKITDCPFIFHNLTKELNPRSYCGVNSLCHFQDNDENGGFWCYSNEVRPATKEQRDLLFEKMHEAGYEWNPDKKELKKIHVIDDGKAEMDYCFTKMMAGEKVSPTWSEEDEHRVKDTIYFLETAKRHYASTVELDACINWLKSIKERCTWKPSDEQMLALNIAIEMEDGDILKSLYDDLKKLKEE